MASNDIKVIIETLLKSDQFKKGLKDMNTSAKNSTKIMSGLKNILAGLGIAFSATMIINAFKKVIQIGKEFEQAIANVASVSGEAKEELAKLARETSKTVVFSARESADAMYFLASAGLKVKDMAQVLNPTLNLAAAAQMEIAAATDMVVNQLKTFRAEMSEAEKYTDIMAKTVSSSNTNMQQLGDALSYAGAIAAQNGISFEDLNAILGTMADQGIKGARAGTQVRMALTNLIKPTTQAQAVLAKYGITQEQINAALHDPIELFKLLKPVTENAADATTLFGVRQQNVIGIIKNGIPRLEELRKGIDGAGGSAKRMAEVQIDTLEGQLKLLNSAFEEIVLQLVGDSGMQDALKKVVTIGKDVLLWISDAIKKIKEFLNSAAGIRTVSAVVLAFKLALDMAKGTIFALARAMISTGKIMINIFKSAGNVVRSVFSGDLKGAVNEAMGTIKNSLKDAGKYLIEPFTSAKDDIMDFYNTWINADDEALKRKLENNKTKVKDEKETNALIQEERLNDLENQKAILEAQKTETLKQKAELLDKIADYAKQGFDVANQYGNVALERQAQRHEKELQDLDKKYAEGLISEQEYNDQKAALEKKQAIEEAQLKRKNAILEKVGALFGIAANTATGIMKVVAASPFTGGMPWTALIAALGAAQAGAVLAAPLPQIPSYQEGTDRTKEGLAYLHDNERVIPANRNIPGISNAMFTDAAMKGLGFGGGNLGNNRYDQRSYNNGRTVSFAGANITVVSNDVDDMLEQLENKANAMGTSLF